MTRLTAEQWEKARAKYEVRGISHGDVARKFGITRQAVSKQARKDGWVQGKSCGIVEKKINALKELSEVERDSCRLPATFQYTIDTVVKERLQAEGLRESFDIALIQKGMELLRAASKTDEWETLTRGRKNLAPMEKPGVNVNVNQTSQTAVLPPPSPRASESLRAALRGDFAGDDA